MAAISCSDCTTQIAHSHCSRGMCRGRLIAMMMMMILTGSISLYVITSPISPPSPPLQDGATKPGYQSLSVKKSSPWAHILARFSQFFHRQTHTSQQRCELLRSACTYVCVCLLITSISQKPNVQTYQIFVACYLWRGSVLLWWRFDMLCNSGFVDDVTFAHNGQARVPEKDSVILQRGGAATGGSLVSTIALLINEHQQRSYHNLNVSLLDTLPREIFCVFLIGGATQRFVRT